DRAAHLASVRGVAAAGRRVVGAAQFDDLAGGVLHDFAAGDESGVAYPHLAARRQAEEALRRVLEEIVAFDKELAAERDPAGAGGGIVGVVDRVELLGLALR